MAAMITTTGTQVATNSWPFCNKNISLCTVNSTLTATTRTTSRSFKLSNKRNRNLSSYPVPLLGLRASSGPNPTDQNSSNDSSSSSTLQDDLNYVLKLVVGSFLGAALIKYGSILTPDITRPNIVQALLMISTPAAVAVFLLLKESRKD